MKYNELENMDEKSLKEQLALMREKLRLLRLRSAVNQLKQVHLIKETRKLIARICTRLTKNRS